MCIRDRCWSGEEFVAPVATLAEPAGTRKDARTDVHDVFVHQVILQTGKRTLDRDELLLGVALVTNEEQTRRQLAETVRAVDKVVAAAQDLHSPVGIGTVSYTHLTLPT